MDKKNTRLEVYKLIEIGKTSKEIAEELKISLRTAQTYIKEHRNIQTQNANKTQDARENKKRKEIAKAKIITGASIKEATAEVGIGIDVGLKLSSRENLQQSQREFLQSLRAGEIERIKQNKLDRLHLNTRFKDSLYKCGASKQMQEMLLLNEKTEQEILELSRLERLERFEFDKEIYTNKLKIDVLEKIKTMTDEELKHLIEYMESKAQS
nr:hypothetical protein [Fusobacterium gastrosuis]